MAIHKHDNQATLDNISSAPLLTNQTSPQTVSNGQATFADGIKLGTAPTVGTFTAGKMFYDATFKTVAAEIDGDVTLQMGQEEHVLCYNNTGVTIPNGSVVRQVGANGDMPTIVLAQADTVGNADKIIGITTQAITDASSGLVTCRGIVHDINTGSYTSGDSLYLSTTTPGALTKTAPTDPSQVSVLVATALLIDGTTGSVYVNNDQHQRLVDLHDVTVSSPTTGDGLVWSGVKWINKAPVVASVGTGVTFYLDNTDIIPAGAGPETLALKSLSKIASVTQYNESAVTNNNTVLIRRFSYNTSIGSSTINSGVWTFNTYCYVDNASQISSLPVSVRRAIVGTGTITITGSGTSRTATISGSAPLETADYNADLTLTGLIETPNGVFDISGAVSGNNTCTITTLSTYTNETSVAFKIHRFMFADATTEVNQTSLYLTTSISNQPSFSVNSTDKLSISYYAKTTSTSNKTVHLYYGGASYTNFTCPLLTIHNEIPGLQGGTGNEYYHLTASQYSALQTGSISTNQIAYASGSNALQGSSNFTYNGTVFVNSSLTRTQSGVQRRVDAYSSNQTLTTSNHVVKFTGTSVSTFTLPAVNAAGSNIAIEFIIKNLGTANLTVLCAGSDTFDSIVTVTSIVLAPTECLVIEGDGVSVWMVV